MQALFVITVIAAGPSEPAGQSNKGHLYLYQKDSFWEIVDKGMWGKITFDLSGTQFSYVFNGHKLTAVSDYSLIYYPDPWTGKGLQCLGSGVVDEYENVYMENSLNTGSLPAPYDEYYSDDPAGAKMWLVLSSEIFYRPGNSYLHTLHHQCCWVSHCDP